MGTGVGEHDARNGDEGVRVAEPGHLVRTLRVESEAADAHGRGSQGGAGLLEHHGILDQHFKCASHDGEAIWPFCGEPNGVTGRRHGEAALRLFPDEGVRL